ncbi:hypothetical protein FS837_008651 [Tulasnella sp. UAMH 9824]|nr:hypothetical protein FS837_008651 [Tulasnella sp. UAMH 9824]
MPYLKEIQTKPDQQLPGAMDGQAKEALPDAEPNSSHAANTGGRCPSTVPNGRPEQDDSLERVLLRFVFEEEYRPLSKATRPLELLTATVQWIEGLIELDRLGIVHRNISYINLMLPASEQGLGPPGSAKIIDLGLAYRKDPQRGCRPARLLLLVVSQKHLLMTEILSRRFRPRLRSEPRDIITTSV